MATRHEANGTGHCAASTNALAGSMKSDVTNLVVGAVVIGGVVLFGNSVEVRDRTMYMAVQTGALLAIAFGVWRIVVAVRRLRIRGDRRSSGAIWKEALRAVGEGDYAQAARLYHEIVKSHPSTAIAEDAENSIELLKKEGKLEEPWC